MKRRVCIITEKEEELRRFIIEDLHSGATIYESIGAYNMQKRNEIIAISFRMLSFWDVPPCSFAASAAPYAPVTS